jgi:AcrR family transcriptional regulator
MALAEDVEPDGRRARRERGRAAVIDALFSLLGEDGRPPTTETLVERSGVSLSSLFRYFASIDDLQQQTIESYFDQFAPLFEVPDIGNGAQPARIRRFADARLDLYEAIAPIARLARARSLDHPRLAETLHQTRSRLADQVGEHFAPEVRQRTRARGEDLVILASSMTSFEAWDLLTATHHRTRAQVHRAWTTGLAALLQHQG